MNKNLLIATVAIAAAGLAAAQTAPSGPKTAGDGIAEYRAMLADGNPADLFEAKGEGLWKTKRGPKAATLEIATWAWARAW